VRAAVAMAEGRDEGVVAGPKGWSTQRQIRVKADKDRGRDRHVQMSMTRSTSCRRRALRLREAGLSEEVFIGSIVGVALVPGEDQHALARVPMRKSS